MPIIKSQKLVLSTAIIIVIIFISAFSLIKLIGQQYKNRIENQAITDTQNQLNQEKYDIRRIKLANENGETIEILQNGTLVRNDKDGEKSAILGFGKLRQLFSSLTEKELAALQNQHSTSNNTEYVLTIETKNGTIYNIYIPIDEKDSPLTDLIDEIEDTTTSTLDPTPFPTPQPSTVTTTPSPTPTGSIEATPTPTPDVTPSIPPAPTPSLLPTASPTTPPFKCSDYPLIKNTIISNIICEPSN